MAKFVYLGDNQFGPNLNLAMDEVLLQRASQDTVHIRFYAFSTPTIVLAYRQSTDDIKQEGVSNRKITVARRLSAGGAMYCDQNSLCYSIIGTGAKPQEEHGNKIAKVLSRELKTDIHIGKEFSLRTGAGVISGNGTRLRKGAYLYHGLIATRPWYLDILNEAIQLSEEEISIIPTLPYISIDREQITQKLLYEFTRGQYEKITATDYESILEGAVRLVSQKYATNDWLNLAKEYNNPAYPKMKTGGGFCFCVTWGEEEKIVDVVRYSQISVGD